MPRRKFEPENWHPEIEKWEKTINDPWYPYKQMKRSLREKEEERKKLLNDEDNPYCKHKRKGWFDHQYICANCGLVLDKSPCKENEPGYDFRNHVMRGKVRKKK